VKKVSGRAQREPVYWLGGIRRIGGVNAIRCGCKERGKVPPAAVGGPADRLVVVVKLLLGAVGVERRGRAMRDSLVDQPVDWTLLVKAVESLDVPAWVVLYVRRWLAADAVACDGGRIRRDRGMPQGGPVSPVLANLFLTPNR
jgi:hypothetical protein